MTDNVFDHPKRNHAKRNVPIGSQIEVNEYHLAKVIDIALDAMHEKIILEKKVASLQEACDLQRTEIIYLRLIISTIVACGDAMTKEQRQSVAAALKDVAIRYGK